METYSCHVNVTKSAHLVIEVAVEAESKREAVENARAAVRAHLIDRGVLPFGAFIVDASPTRYQLHHEAHVNEKHG